MSGCNSKPSCGSASLATRFTETGGCCEDCAQEASATDEFIQLEDVIGFDKESGLPVAPWQSAGPPLVVSKSDSTQDIYDRLLASGLGTWQDHSSSDTATSTFTGDDSGGTGGMLSEVCIDPLRGHSCTLYVFTKPGGTNDFPGSDELEKGLIESALRYRHSKGGATRLGEDSEGGVNWDTGYQGGSRGVDKEGDLGTGKKKKAFPFVAVLEYSCHDDPLPRMEIYRTTKGGADKPEGSKGKRLVDYQPDLPVDRPEREGSTRDTPRDIRERRKRYKDNKKKAKGKDGGSRGNDPAFDLDLVVKGINEFKEYTVTMGPQGIPGTGGGGGSPATPGGGPSGTPAGGQPAMCYIAVADTPTGSTIGKNKGFLIIGTVVWHVGNVCFDAGEQPFCTRAKTIHLVEAVGDKGPTAKEGEWSEDEIDQFYATGHGPLPGR